MGIVVVLAFYAIALTVISTISSAAFGMTAHYLTRKAPARRRRAVVVSVLFPFACLCFAGAWFISYAVINSYIFHRDPMLGDTWETPLPNGYALLMIDVTDEGTVYNPKTQAGDGSVSSRQDAAFGVRQLQVAGSNIYGARDSGYFGRIGQDSKQVDTWFEIDTARNLMNEFKTPEELRRQVLTEGNTLHLREFQSVFGDYRTTWFDYLAGVVLLLVPACSFVLLARWIWRMHRFTIAT